MPWEWAVAGVRTADASANERVRSSGGGGAARVRQTLPKLRKAYLDVVEALTEPPWLPTMDTPPLLFARIMEVLTHGIQSVGARGKHGAFFPVEGALSKRRRGRSCCARSGGRGKRARASRGWADLATSVQACDVLGSLMELVAPAAAARHRPSARTRVIDTSAAAWTAYGGPPGRSAWALT